MPQKQLKVTVASIANGVSLKSGSDEIQVTTSHPESIIFPDRADFAAWYFLPIAMRTNRSLYIEGRGTKTTTLNAQKLSDIWQSWLPGHFRSIDVAFAEEAAVETSGNAFARDLCFYSGGLDAAYTLLKRLRAGQPQDLLTVHGMDYTLQDQAGFESLLEKTDAFARRASDTRIIVRSDAYSTYEKYQINLKRHHLSHIFSLAGAGFLHGKKYRNLILAADERLDGQFLAQPWGTNSATDFLFDDGISRIITESDDVSRSEKMPLVLQSEEALSSLAFCWNRKIQPNNCGICLKCLRTKLMFLASTGAIPPIFLSNHIRTDWPGFLGYRSPADLAGVLEVIVCAKRNGFVDLIPGLGKAEQEVFDYYEKIRRIEAFSERVAIPKSLRKLFRKRVSKK